MRNPYTIFQNPSMQGSEVMLHMYASNSIMHGRTNEPEAICPSNFFEAGSIIRAHFKEISSEDFMRLLFTDACVIYFFLLNFFINAHHVVGILLH